MLTSFSSSSYRSLRAGQTVVEAMLLTSVVVVAVVAVGWILAGDEMGGGFIAGMKNTADAVDVVYSEEPGLPIPGN
jgi:hypothetical protein